MIPSDQIPQFNVLSIAISRSGVPRTSHLHLGDPTMSEPAANREHLHGPFSTLLSRGPGNTRSLNWKRVACQGSRAKPAFGQIAEEDAAVSARADDVQLSRVSWNDGV